MRSKTDIRPIGKVEICVAKKSEIILCGETITPTEPFDCIRHLREILEQQTVSTFNSAADLFEEKLLLFIFLFICVNEIRAITVNKYSEQFELHITFVSFGMVRIYLQIWTCNDAKSFFFFIFDLFFLLMY